MDGGAPGQTGDEATEAEGSSPTHPEPDRRLRPAISERPPVTLGTTGAAVGSALAVIGVYVVSFDSLATDDLGAEGGSAIPGLVMSLVLVSAGLGLQLLRRSAALSAAGIGMLAVGVPATIWFATWDVGDVPPSDIGALLTVTGVVLTVLYLAGPARDHAVLLGAGATSLWLAALEVGEGVFSSPYGGYGYFPLSALTPRTPFDDAFFFPDVDLPDATNLGILSLFFGLSYLGIGWWCDRQGRRGTATPLLGVGLAALVTGVSYLGDDLGTGGAGLLLALLGAAVLGIGVRLDRRATARLAGLGIVVGLVLVVTDSFEDDPSIAGLVLVVLGLVGIGLAHAVAEATAEPDPYATPPRSPADGHAGEGGLMADVAPQAAWMAFGSPRATGPLEGASVRDQADVSADLPAHPPSAPPVRQPSDPEPDAEGGPPAPGWWLASDGRWYPPDQQPGPG